MLFLIPSSLSEPDPEPAYLGGGLEIRTRSWKPMYQGTFFKCFCWIVITL